MLASPTAVRVKVHFRMQKHLVTFSLSVFLSLVSVVVVFSLSDRCYFKDYLSPASRLETKWAGKETRGVMNGLCKPRLPYVTAAFGSNSDG